MPNINLIALRRGEKKKIERITKQLFVTLAGCVGGFALLIMFLGAQRAILNSSLEQARADLKKLEPTLKAIADMEAATAELRPKVSTLEQAKLGTLRYRNLFQVVSRSVPGNVWLGALNSSGLPEDTLVSFVGVSQTQTLVGEMMTNMQKVPLFDRVELKYTTLANSGDNMERFAFEVSAHLKPPPASVAAATPLPDATGTPPAGTPTSGTPAPAGTPGVAPTPTGAQAAPAPRTGSAVQGGQNGRS